MSDSPVPALKLSSVDPMRYDDLRSDVLRRAEDLADRMRTLEDDRTVEVIRDEDGDVVHEHSRGAVYLPPQDRPNDDEHSRLYDECTYWESRSDFSLTEDYERTALSEDTTRVELPNVLLQVYDGDPIRWNLEGVFPSIYEETGIPVTVEDYLSTLEQGGDWRPAETDLVQISHKAKHDALRNDLAGDPTRVGPGWSLLEEQVPVPSASGVIDLLFDHDRHNRYLLVVVAPDPTDQDDFDRAFGRAIRLRDGFMVDVAPPSLSPDAVDLAIATPMVPERYEWVADEFELRFVEAST